MLQPIAIIAEVYILIKAQYVITLVATNPVTSPYQTYSPSHSPPFNAHLFSSVSCIASHPYYTFPSSIFPCPIKSVTAFGSHRHNNWHREVEKWRDRLKLGCQSTHQWPCPSAHSVCVFESECVFPVESDSLVRVCYINSC